MVLQLSDKCVSTVADDTFTSFNRLIKSGGERTLLSIEKEVSFSNEVLSVADVFDKEERKVLVIPDVLIS